MKSMAMCVDVNVGWAKKTKKASIDIAVIQVFGGVEFFTLYFSHKEVMESFWNLLEYATQVQGDEED